MNVGTPHYTAIEERYHALFDHAMDELSKDFFFSYTYDITKHLQTNCASAATAATTATAAAAAAASLGSAATGVGGEVLCFEDRFCWNQFLLTEFINHASPGWVLPVSLGCVIQKSCNVFSHMVTVTVIGRRSRHFAGTRYVLACGKPVGCVFVFCCACCLTVDWQSDIARRHTLLLVSRAHVYMCGAPPQVLEAWRK